jgi:hypothetical protein
VGGPVPVLAGCSDESDGVLTESSECAFDDGDRFWVGPVQIVDHKHDRGAPGELAQDFLERDGGRQCGHVGGGRAPAERDLEDGAMLACDAVEHGEVEVAQQVPEHAVGGVSLGERRARP